MENLTDTATLAEIVTNERQPTLMSDAYTIANSLCDRALALQVNHHHHAEAQRLYEQALAALPSHYRAAFLLSELHAAADRLEPAANFARLAYRIAPSESSRKQVIDAMVKLSFHHAQHEVTVKLLADFDYLLSIAANDEATALHEFIKELYRDNSVIAAAMLEILIGHDQAAWAREWGYEKADQPAHEYPLKFWPHGKQTVVPHKPEALSAPAGISTLWLNLTSRCNLRCVYCTVGTASHIDADLSPESLEKVMRFIRDTKPGRINFGCYAETTMYKDWHLIVKEVIDLGISVNIISNLARVLTPDEIEVFSQCDSLQNSVDTVDIDRQKALRKGADIRGILYNIQRIRARSLQLGRATPWISWICVPTPENIPYLLDYVGCAIVSGIKAIDINPLLQFSDSKVTIADLLDLPDAEFLQAYDYIKEAMAFAQQHNITLTLNNQLLFDERVARIAAGNVEGPLVRQELRAALGRVSFYAKNLQPGNTRLCTLPWDTSVLYGNGDVLPCTICGTPMGNLAQFESLEAAMACEPLNEWRRNLLTGNLGEACTNCLRAPEGSTEALSALIADLHTQQ